MTLAILLVIAATLSLVVILGLSVSRNLRLSANDAAEIQPVNLDAFRNLIDPRERDYLRRHLSSAEFRRVERLRLRAMAAYIQVVAQNAAVLVRVGQLAVQTSDTHTSEAARQLIDEALLLRRNAAIALLKIYIVLPWPDAGFAPAPILDGYQHLSGSAMLLGRLQNPGSPVRLASF
jgi:hypothetical protein